MQKLWRSGEGTGPAQVLYLLPQGLVAILAQSAALLQTPAVAEPTEVGIELSAEASPVVTDIQPTSHWQDVRIGRGRHAHDPRGGVAADDGMTVPLAGQLGHGITASVRRQPVRIVEGGKEGGYRDAFEVVCCECGDHPYWDYSEISLSLQRIRGPYTTRAAALEAYDQHLGLGTARRRS